MKILKTLVHFDDFDSYRVDTVEWNRRLWLVPEWITSLATGERQPVRIIAMDRLPHGNMEDEPGIDFQLGIVLPKCILSGQIPPGSDPRYEIVESPPFRIQKPPVPKPH